jgi:hypothetical protein
MRIGKALVPDLTINMLAAELDILRRSLERLLDAGKFVPTYRTVDDYVSAASWRSRSGVAPESGVARHV